MNLFWWLGEWRRDVPGHWDYRTGTIGDGVLLPLAAGLLVAAGDRLPRAPGESAVTAGAGTIGAGVGATVQLLWLRNPDSRLSWTMPAPHTLNAPGIYHAALLTAGGGFFSAITVRAAWRARACRATHPLQVEAMLRDPAAAVLVACIVGFAGLVVLDFPPTAGTLSKTAAAGAVTAGTALSIGLLVWSFGRGVARGWRCLSTGFLGGGAIFLISRRIDGPARRRHLRCRAVGVQ
jgi:hypothetical protein